MAKETVKSLVRQVADGTMGAAEAGRKMRDLITRREPPRTEAERMKRMYEGHHEMALETDPNSFTHVYVLYDSRKISKAQLEAIEKAIDETRLSEGLEYYLTEGDPPHPVRKMGGDVAEVFTGSGKWIASTAYDARSIMTEDLTACSEQEALAAAKKVMGA